MKYYQGFWMTIGLLFISGSIGTIYESVHGCLTFGIGLVLLILLDIIKHYLNDKPRRLKNDNQRHWV